MLLVLLISAVGLSIALGNTSETQGTTGAVSTKIATAVTAIPPANVACASNTPCEQTFTGMQQCKRISDRYAQQGIPNAINCVNNCCIILPR